MIHKKSKPDMNAKKQTSWTLNPMFNIKFVTRYDYTLEEFKEYERLWKEENGTSKQG